jgi:micrococcal nuclease
LLIVARNYWSEPPASIPIEPPVVGAFDVVRVVDGDTIIIAPNKRVRLIGVNAPESVKPDSPVEPWGPEAGEFTREFLAGGTVRLEYDRERVDRFGRYLAYVWVGKRMLNEELLRAGLAHWERHFNYASEKKQRFREAQDEARRAGRGIWSNARAPANTGAIRIRPSRLLACA